MEGNWNGALGQNKYQLTGIEWQDDFGLGWSHHNARFYDPAVARWWAVDALAEAYVSYSPYNYVMGQVTTTIDPSGMEGEGADGLTNEQWLNSSRPGANPGLRQEYQQFNRNLEIERLRLHSNIRNALNGKTSGSVIAYGTRIYIKGELVSDIVEGYHIIVNSLIIEISGQMRNQKIGDVTINLIEIRPDNTRQLLISLHGVAGGFGNGAPENGSYTVSNYRDRGVNGDYHKGMNLNNIGFSFDLDPSFKIGRTLLRIHPDGNNEGTLGCIGLHGTSKELIFFRDTLINYLKTHCSVLTKINISGNPNNNGNNANKIPSIKE